MIFWQVFLLLFAKKHLPLSKKVASTKQSGNIIANRQEHKTQ